MKLEAPIKYEEIDEDEDEEDEDAADDDEDDEDDLATGEDRTEQAEEVDNGDFVTTGHKWIGMKVLGYLVSQFVLTI